MQSMVRWTALGDHDGHHDRHHLPPSPASDESQREQRHRAFRGHPAPIWSLAVAMPTHAAASRLARRRGAARRGMRPSKRVQFQWLRPGARPAPDRRPTTDTEISCISPRDPIKSIARATCPHRILRGYACMHACRYFGAPPRWDVQPPPGLGARLSGRPPPKPTCGAGALEALPYSRIRQPSPAHAISSHGTCSSARVANCMSISIERTGWRVCAPAVRPGARASVPRPARPHDRANRRG